jgi:hypothetical protein
VAFDVASYGPQRAQISQGPRDLEARQQEARDKFGAELAAAREALFGEINAVKAALPPLSEGAAPAAPAPVPPRPLPASAVAVTQFSYPFNAQAPLEGVIAGLTRQGGGNVADTGAVEVSASACLNESRFPPRFAADLTGDNVFVSVDKPNQWLCYNFAPRRLRVTHYAIRSRFDGWANSNNPKSWVVEVSPDAENWTLADTQADNDDLNNTNRIKAFELLAPVEGQYVRLRQTAAAHSDKNVLAISGFELFGTLIP